VKQILATILCFLLVAPAALAESEAEFAGPEGASVEAGVAASPVQTAQAEGGGEVESPAETEAPVPEGQIEMPAAEPPPTQPQAANIFNPTVTVFGNLVGRLDSRKVFGQEPGARLDNRFLLRESEVDLRAAVDPFADAVLIVALEGEPGGESTTRLEEGYVTIKKLPFWEEMPGGLKLKAGHFRTEFGRLNLLHTHDLPQTTRPLAMEELLGPEGFMATGLSGNFFLPGGGANSAMDATVQILSGGGIRLAQEGVNHMALLGHLRWFGSFAGGQKDVEVGLSTYLGRTDPAGARRLRLHGLDLSYKWKPYLRGEWKSLVAAGEAFWADRKFSLDTNGDGMPDAAARAKPCGAFGFVQYQWDRRLYTGLRGDYVERIDDDSLQRRLLAAYLSYYTSEFLRLRVGWERRFSDLAEEDKRTTLFLEANWVFGAHPPEPWWVNR